VKDLSSDSIDDVVAYVQKEKVDGFILSETEPDLTALMSSHARRARLSQILKLLCTPFIVSNAIAGNSNDSAEAVGVSVGISLSNSHLCGYSLSSSSSASFSSADASLDTSIAIGRLKDVPVQDLGNFNPINGLWHAPLLSLTDALAAVPLSVDSEWDKANAKQTNQCYYPLFMCAQNALRFARNRLVAAAAAVEEFAEQRMSGASAAASASSSAPEPERLSVDEIAAIHLYTQETPFYPTLNALLRSSNRTLLTPYLPYLRLFVTALGKLKPTQAVVYRGVNVDLSAQYLTGLECVWWPISITTSEVNVLSNPMFFDLAQPRTLFTIQTKHAVDIRHYSSMPNEAELVLLPGACLKVTGVLKMSENPKCVMVTLIETDARPMTLVNAPVM
jgi:hypothetical protein